MRVGPGGLDLEAEVHRVLEGLPGRPLELLRLGESELPPVI